MDTVLHLQCGTGRLTKKISESAHNPVVLGIELRPEMVEQASIWANPRLRFRAGDVRMASAGSLKPDVIVLSSLELLDDNDLRMTLENAKVTVRRAGTLIISSISPERLAGQRGIKIAKNRSIGIDVSVRWGHGLKTT